MENFHSEIEKLRQMPIKIDVWAYKQIGKRNEGSFKRNYQNLIVKECGEKLISVVKLKLSQEDYYLKKFFSKKNIFNNNLIPKEIFLRESHAKRLAKADKYFRKRGLYIHIVSGWRNPKLQKIIKNDYAKKFGQIKADRMYASTDGKVPAPHCTGAAVDLKLRDLSTNEKIKMNVFFEKEEICSLYWGEELLKQNKLNKISVEGVKNRRILYHVLCTKGIIFERKKDLFTAHPGEYWHYSDGDVLSSFLKRKKIIKYGVVFPEIK